MKNRLIFILPVLFVSCARFAESPIATVLQPDEGIELSEIPAKLTGTYKSLVDSLDSAHIIVTDKEIIMKIVRHPNISIAELDSTERIKFKDTIFREGNDSMTVSATADSVF